MCNRLSSRKLVFKCLDYEYCKEKVDVKYGFIMVLITEVVGICIIHFKIILRMFLE